jgi:hypothetical protein
MKVSLKIPIYITLVFSVIASCLMLLSKDKGLPQGVPSGKIGQQMLHFILSAGIFSVATTIIHFYALYQDKPTQKKIVAIQTFIWTSICVLDYFVPAVEGDITGLCVTFVVSVIHFVALSSDK